MNSGLMVYAGANWGTRKVDKISKPCEVPARDDCGSSSQQELYGSSHTAQNVQSDQFASATAMQCTTNYFSNGMIAMAAQHISRRGLPPIS